MINSIKQKREFLGIKDVTTEKQKKNGTVIWQLPIKKHGSFIEVGSFESGYVRRMNGCWTPYQLNKTENCDNYYPETKWCDDTRVGIKTGKYNKYVGKKRILIPGYWDRLEYLMAYCLKNYYINQANEVENGKFIPKWRHEFEMKNGNIDKIRELQAENKRLTQEMDDICEEHNSKDQKYTYSGGQVTNNENGDIYVHEQHAYWNKLPSSVQVIVDGHRYKIK
jgi:hypothetical protein